MESDMKYPVYNKGTTVYSENPWNYICHICPEKRKNSLEDHLKDDNHLQRLKYYTQFFTNTGSVLHCKLCLKLINLSQVIEHAFNHKLIPWYVPDNSPVILFKNFISQREHQYFCHLCNVKLPFWFSVEHHIEDSHHQTLKRDKIDEVIFKNLSLTISCYELAINNSIFMKSSECLSCSLCDCEVKTSYEEIVNHIEKKSHIKNQKENIKAVDTHLSSHKSGKEMRAKSRRESSDKIPSTDSLESKKETTSNINKKIAGNNNVSKNDKISEKYNTSIQKHKLIDHIPEGIIHVIDEFYECTICKFRFPGLMLVRKHVETLYHRKKILQHSKSKSNSMISQQSVHSSFLSSSSASTSHEGLHGETSECLDGSLGKVMKLKNSPKNGKDDNLPTGIIQFSEDLYKCSLCKCTLSHWRCMIEHVNGVRHKSNVILFDKKTSKKSDEMSREQNPDVLPIEIIHVHKNMYRCTVCNIGTLGIKDIPHHMNGFRHKEQLRLRLLVKETELKVSNTSAALEPPHDLPEKLRILGNGDRFWCTLCSIEGFFEQASIHARGQKHKTKLEQWRKRELRRDSKKMLEPSPPESSQGDPSTQRLISNFHLGNRVDTVPSSVKPEANRKILPQSIRNVPCEICNCMIPGGNWNVNIHRNSKEHLENEARVKISFKSSNEKETRACSPQLPREFTLSDIPSDNIVQYHYIGHIIESIECKICGSKIRGTFQTSVIFEYLKHTMSKEHMDNELKFIDNWKLSVLNSYATKASVPPKKKSIMKRQMKLQHYRNEDIPCLICGVKFKYEKGLHSHMTKHFWKRFMEVQKFSEETSTNDKHKDLNKIPYKHFVDLEYENGKSFVTPHNVEMSHLDIALDNKLNIYNIDRQKIENLELGVLLSFTIDQDNIYCLVCCKTIKNTLQNFYEHLCSVFHLDYLQRMIEDHRKFTDYPDQLSDLGLAHEYMQEVSEDDVWCHACGISVKNQCLQLNDHINDSPHTKKWSSLGANAKECFEALLSRMDANFYSCRKYWCVPCKMSWGVEIEFRQHLNKKKHREKIQSFKNKTMIFDYCALCATLWYGFLKTYSYHSTCKMHKNQAVHSYFLVNKIPNTAETLLRGSEKKIEEILTNVDNHRVNDREKEDQLIKDLEGICTEEYPNVIAYPFGSRISELAGSNSDLDIFFDCSTEEGCYSGENSSQEQVLLRLENIKKCLDKDYQNWHVDRAVRDCRIPIIKATHRPTGIKCDISFSNGLSVENTKMIKAYCESYPHARKLIIFVKNWMVHCELTGVNGINSYGIAWLVIYFLQVKMILPTVSELIERRQESRIIGGWETGVSTDFQSRATDESFKELLMQFFRFYEDFDYRNYVICPLVGRAVGKEDFERPTLLPDAMKPYFNYLKGVDDPEPFRVDSVMCLQDPFDLSHNISRAVKKFMVHRFKTLCSLSAQIVVDDA